MSVNPSLFAVIEEGVGEFGGGGGNERELRETAKEQKGTLVAIRSSLALPQMGHTWMTQLVGRLRSHRSAQTKPPRRPEPPAGWAREGSHRWIG